MDKVRIAGSAKQVKGSVKEAIGKVNRRYQDASRRGGRESGWQGAEHGRRRQRCGGGCPEEIAASARGNPLDQRLRCSADAPGAKRDPHAGTFPEYLEFVRLAGLIAKYNAQ